MLTIIILNHPENGWESNAKIVMVGVEQVVQRKK